MLIIFSMIVGSIFPGDSLLCRLNIESFHPYFPLCSPKYDCSSTTELCPKASIVYNELYSMHPEVASYILSLGDFRKQPLKFFYVVLHSLEEP